MFMDGSSSSNGSDTRLILTSSKVDVVEYTLHFRFPTTNNEA